MRRNPARPWAAIALALALAPSAAHADAPARPIARHHRRHHRIRDRFANSIALGATAGVGSPLGLAGAFVEYRPWRWVALAAGGGAGGSFGPAVGGTMYLDPIGTRGWELGAGASLSHNFSYVSGTIIAGRNALPVGTNWGSVELETSFRPSRHWFIRVGFGRAFLFDTQAFYLGTPQELSMANLPTLPFQSPVDAIRAASRHEGYGVWFFHIDIGPAWSL